MAKSSQKEPSSLNELAAINEISEILRQGKGLTETLQKIATRFPVAMKVPFDAFGQIRFGKELFTCPDCQAYKPSYTAHFQSIDGIKGELSLCVDPEINDFEISNTQQQLIKNIAKLIERYIDDQKAREMVQYPDKSNLNHSHTQEEHSKLSTQQILQRFLDRHNTERNLFHDLMPFKVKEILLIANLYDAYIIEGEGRFSDHILGEYHQINLGVMPRVTGVSSGDEALKRLKIRHFDIIIIMVGVDKKNPLKIAKQIETDYPYIPTYLLLNNHNDLAPLSEELKGGPLPENLFIWNGDSKVFFAMVKLLEDMVNAGNDTILGVTRIILLVEDSPEFYSKYLSILYHLVLDQTRHLIEDVGIDDIYKVLKLRARPKILLARNYEQAMQVIKEFGDNLLCLISDVRFPKNGELSDTAGFELIEHIQKTLPSLPVALQSSDTDNAREAQKFQVHFINKNSETLLQDLKYFINYHIGFGHFVYRDHLGREIAIARSMNEFESFLKTIPEDSLGYHAMKNHFSMWLMARGEVEAAKLIYPLKVSDFENLGELRELLLKLIVQKREEKSRGKIINFDKTALLDEKNIVRMASGSLGGKGRGLAFINTLIYDFNFTNLMPGINIRMPRTAIIGTDEFDAFLDHNKLHKVIHSEKDFQVLQQYFLNANLSSELEEKLVDLLEQMVDPIAIRSSSLLEDSINQPFAGVFSTYFLPNNNPDFSTRLQQLKEAIKLVYASIYSKNARAYFQAINYRAEDEKMAVVIQEVVGSVHEKIYYPHISGTAQSYNYYPFAHMKPEEGFALAAVGLGLYVVSGEKAFRFSPVYPDLQINTPKYLFRNSQVWFYAINLGRERMDLRKGELAGLLKVDVDEAEKHGTLKHAGSVYRAEDNQLIPGIDQPGPRVLNFANILKYNYIPLAKTLSSILDIMREAFGSQIEIEYAVELEPDGKASFYLLQVKPLIGVESNYRIDLKALDKNKMLLFTQKSMGNGMLQDLHDIVYIDPGRFDKMFTREMAQEIEDINKKMIEEGRKYILIGPGRWGTRDRFIGIPVTWSQISNARVIVEMSLEDFPLDASLGSHFFHNITSMNVGYFSVNHTSIGDFIDWDQIKEQELVNETVYFKHIRFKENLVVQMDGKKRLAVIMKSK